MRNLIVLAGLLFSVSSFANVSNVGIITTYPRNQYAVCLAKLAINNVIAKDARFQAFELKLLKYTHLDNYEGKSQNATLAFDAGNSADTQWFNIVLFSENGWELMQGSTGEIYPYASSASSIASVTYLGKQIGQVDITSCR